MKWDDSVTSKCRYGDRAGEAFRDPEVLWERSLADYQGHAAFLGWDGARIVFYEWSYGSCSGCDNWEKQSLEGEKLVLTIRGQGEYFEDAAVLRKFFAPIYDRATDWGSTDYPNQPLPFEDIMESARLYLTEARENDPQG